MDVDPPTDGCHRWFYHVWPISSGHSRFFRKFLNQSSTFRFHKGTIGNGHSWGHLDGLQDINYFQEEGSSLSWFCWIPEDTKKQAEGWKTAIIQPCIFPWFVELYQQNTLWGKLCVDDFWGLKQADCLSSHAFVLMWRTMARKVSNCFLFYVRNSISPAWGG